MLLLNRFKIFKKLNFSLLFFGIFVSNLGSVIYSFVLGWYILEKTGSPLQMGGLISIPYIINIFFSPLFGVLSDKLNKLKIVYITDYIRGLLMLSVIPIFLLGFELNVQIIIFYIITVIETFTGLLFRNASFSLRKNVVDNENVGQANALFILQDTISKVIGVMLAGILYKYIGIKTIFFINGITYILSAISEMFIELYEDINTNKNKKMNIYKDLIEGFKYIFKTKILIAIITSSIFINIGINLYLQIVIPYLYNLHFKLSLIELSYIRTSQTIGVFIVSFFLSVKVKNTSIFKNIKNSIFFLLLVSIGLFITFLLYNKSFISNITFNIMMSSLFLLLGVSISLFNIPLNSFFHKYVPTEVLGRVYSSFNTFSHIFTPFTIILSGYFINAENIYLLNLLFILFMLSALSILILNKKEFENKNIEVVA